MPRIIPEPRYFLDPLDRRCRGLEERGSELDTVRAVVDPAPAGLDVFASRDHSGVANEGDEITLASRLNPQNAEAVLGVMERDAVD
jgi:hypothetical protein